MEERKPVYDKNGALLEAHCPGLKLVNRGKVRDIYEFPDSLLIVATDRISAFDKVMKQGVLHRGLFLTSMTLSWLKFLEDIIPNHLITADVVKYPKECRSYQAQLSGRSMFVKKARPLPVECIVRGYISGSFWEAYKESENGVVCGFQLPEGMVESGKFPEPLFTPSTKAEAGMHDENISYERMEEILGKELSSKVRDVSLRIYKRAEDYAQSKGIIIADTKFEFGLDENDELILIDEVLTPDSSRFWPEDKYVPGKGQSSFDKQILRDYLKSVGYSGEGPPPELPGELLEKIAKRYLEARNRLFG